MPVLPRLNPRPGSFGRQAQAGDLGAAEGQAQTQGGELFSQLGNTANALVEADQSARISRAVAQAAVQLDDVQTQLAQDPDFTTHDERFEKARTEILQNVGQGILPGRFSGELDDKLFPVAARVRADVRDQSRRLLVDQSVALLDQTGVDWGNRAARAPIGSASRGEAFDQMSEAIRSATGRGIITAQDAIARLRTFQREVSDSDRRAAIAADPLAALKELQKADSPLAAGLTEGERQQVLDHARTEYRQQLEEQHSAVRFNEEQAKRAKEERGAAATKAADDALAKRDVAGVQQVLRSSRKDLTPTEYRYFLDHITGTGVTPKTIPQVYLDLSERASRGEAIEPAAAEAYRSGTLDQGDYDRVLKASKDRRFGDVEDFLRQATRPGLFEIDSSRAQKSAEIERSFREWMAATPEATAPEALEHGRALLRGQGIKDGTQLRRPADPGSETGKVDIRAAVSDVLAKGATGDLAPDAVATELARLQALQKAQDLQGTTK